MTLVIVTAVLIPAMMMAFVAKIALPKNRYIHRGVKQLNIGKLACSSLDYLRI
jgi:hypothetical protein